MIYTDGRTDENKSQTLFKKYVRNNKRRSMIAKPLVVLEKSKTLEEYWEPSNISASSILSGKRERKVVAYNK